MSNDSSDAMHDPADLESLRETLWRDGADALRLRFAKLTLDSLLAWCEAFWATQGLEQIVRDAALARFDAIANAARASAVHDLALRAFKAKLIYSSNDQNVRFAIAEYLWQAGDTAGVLNILRPTIDLSQPPGAFEMYVRAALAEGEFAEISRFGHQMMYENPTDTNTNERIRAVSTLIAITTVSAIAETGEIPERLQDARALTAVIDVAGRQGMAHVTDKLIEAVRTVDKMAPVAEALLRLQSTHNILRTAPNSFSEENSSGLVSLAIRTRLFWTASTAFAQCSDNRITVQMQALGQIAELVDMVLRASSAIAQAWASRKCLDAIRRNRVERLWVAEFVKAEKLLDELAQRLLVVRKSFPPVCAELVAELHDIAAEFASMPRKYTAHSDENRKALRERRKTRIYYIITWHVDSSSLVRLISAIYDEANFYLVIVGGSNSRQQVDAMLWLMARSNIMIMNGAPTAWGGRTLLFENVFQGLALFRSMPERCHWVQILCNKSFPLISQDEMRSRLEDITCHALLQTLPPLSYRQSFYTTPDNAFDSLVQFKHRVFARADLRHASVAEMDFGDLVAHSYNFAGDRQPLAVGFKTREQSYDVAGLDADIRNMSWARFIEIVDTTDDGRIATSMLSPFHQAVLHRILKRYTIHTGDPFVMMSAAFVDYLFTNDQAAELYLAMAHQFAPEMNFFDTALMNSPHRAQPSHLYYRGRRGDQTVEEEDIDGALVSPKFFVRKVDRPEGVEFAKYFGQRLHDRLPERERIWVAEIPGIRARPLMRDPEQVARWPNGSWTLRDLNHRVLSKATVQEDGMLLDDGKRQIGTWVRTDRSIEVVLNAERNNPIEYRRATVADGHVIRVPEQIAWVGSDWGRFWSRPLADCFFGEHIDKICALPLHSITEGFSESGLLLTSRNQVSAVFSVFSNVQGDPMVAGVDRVNGKLIEVGRDSSGRLITAVETPSGSLRLEVVEVLFSGERAVLVMRQTAQTRWHPMSSVDLVVSFSSSDAIGRWRLVSQRFPKGIDVILRHDNRTSDGNVPMGFWKLIDGKILIVDNNPWPIIELPQQTWTPSGWRAAGYGQYDLAQDDYLIATKYD